MEKPLYPSKYMRITQGYMEGSHLGSYAIDEAGKDTQIDKLYAPFTGIIKKTYTSDANEIWFESIEKVEYPDGTIDYMTILFAHNNDISDLYIGKTIKQGEVIYKEGTKGNTTGNHCHLECGKGKFTGSGWYKNSFNNWVINNGKIPTECLWIDDSITVLDSHNYTFKKIEELKEEPIEEPVEENKDNASPEEPIEESPNQSTTKKLIFICEKSDLYAIELKKGQKLYLE